MRFFLSISIALILSAPFVWGQAPGTSSNPRAVSLCQLKKNPKTYNRQWVSVRGGISLQFEDFTLYDSECHELEMSGVWLMFGGDQETPATFCCGNHTPPRGKDVSVEGQRVPLVRDAKFRELLRTMTAKRIRRPSGEPCEQGECDFYSPITATLEGFFLSGYDETKEKALPGYGHLGCCHLLVVRRVDKVSAERTPVPAGGEFKC